MKKIIFSAALLLAAIPAVAQEEYLPVAGKFSTEIQFNPFSDDYSTFKIDQIKLRYMITDNDALRFGIGFGFESNKVTPEPDADDELWGKSSNGNISINFGYERHFLKTNRIDLYAGAGIGYRHDFASAKYYANDDNGETEYKLHNASVERMDDITNIDPSMFTARAANEFRVNVFTGIDFYVYRGLYVGAELGLRFGFSNEPGWYTEGPGIDDNGNQVDNFKSDASDKTSGFSFTTYCEPAVRLGWTF